MVRLDVRPEDRPRRVERNDCPPLVRRHQAHVTGDVGGQNFTASDKPWATVPSGVTTAFLKAVWGSGPNDVWVVVDRDGRETLVPVLKDVIVSVDVAAKLIGGDPHQAAHELVRLLREEAQVV